MVDEGGEVIGRCWTERSNGMASGFSPQQICDITFSSAGTIVRVHLDLFGVPFRQECRLVVERGRTVLTCHSPGSAQAVQPANVECGSLLPPFAPCFESGKGGGKPSQSKAAPFERGIRETRPASTPTKSGCTPIIPFPGKHEQV
jgi:hypothetical protein